MKSYGTGIADLLQAMPYRTDPLADQAIADILGPGSRLGLDAAADPEPWQRLGLVTQLTSQWTRNRDLAQWAQRSVAPGSSFAAGPQARITREVVARLAPFVQTARVLPEWADPQRLMRAEQMFAEHGAPACALLFCAGLPESYVVPDIAAVLQAGAASEGPTGHRLRAAAALLFPVLGIGGLTTEAGSGIAQLLKVRLIHATVRHLLLRGPPAQGGRALPALPLPPGTGSLHQRVFAHGWTPGTQGLPCNQEELAYTLLCFGHVFLRSLRRLGQALHAQDEQDHLHAWNVAGHLLGIERDLMAGTMAQAQELFMVMQARGRAAAVAPDRRPALAGALMQTLEAAIPSRALRPLPVLMVRLLCGRTTLRSLGLTRRAPLHARLLFGGAVLLVRVTDTALRRTAPGLSIARLLVRVMGYHAMTRMLMAPPLSAPALAAIRTVMDRWGPDPEAPRWVQALEARLTTAQARHRVPSG